MDHNTQQNAALVEQTAAAAESLSTQAQQLVRTIVMFLINQGKIKKVSNINEKLETFASSPESKLERRAPNRPQNISRLKANLS